MRRHVSSTSLTTAEKIKQALQRYNRTPGKSRMTQKELAEKIDIPESTLSRWMSGERAPNREQLAALAKILDASELLDLPGESADDFHIVNREEHGVRWVQSIPPYFTPEDLKEMETGLDIFERFFVKHQSTQEVLQDYPTKDVKFLYNTYKSAVRANCLQLTHVPRADDLEQKLKAAFGTQLRQVFVADIDERCDCSPIRSEFVAWLFAIQCLPSLADFKHIGLGYGYTLLRVPEIAVPNHITFNGVNWIPLSATHYEYSNRIAEMTTAAKIPSANYIARRLENKYPSSVGWYRRYYANEAVMEKENLRDYRDYKEQERNLDTIIASVNGPGRKSAADTVPPQATQWRTSDYVSLANMKDIYNILKKRLKPPYSVGGEILGVFFDNRGKQIFFADSEAEDNMKEENQQFADDEHIQIYLGEGIQSAFFQLDLQTLWEVRRNGSVWIVASRNYKAAPIYYALKGGLANALVIDREIASILLDMKAQGL